MKTRITICSVLLCMVLVTGCSSRDTAGTTGEPVAEMTDMPRVSDMVEMTDMPEVSDVAVVSDMPEESGVAEVPNMPEASDMMGTSTTAKTAFAGKSAAKGKASITIEKAKKIALKKAGLKETDGRWKKEREDWEDGRRVYELEFISGRIEYEFEIDAENGNILEYDMDDD